MHWGLFLYNLKLAAQPPPSFNTHPLITRFYLRLCCSVPGNCVNVFSCYCGTAAEDYAKHGASELCAHRCTGDVQYTCGGSVAMDVFAINGES